MYSEVYLKRIVVLSLYFLTLSFSILAIYSTNEFFIFYCIFALSIEITIISFINKNFTLLFFLFTFIFFQMSRLFLYYLGLTDLNWRRGYVGDFFDDETALHTLKSFVIVLSALFFSQFLITPKKNKVKKSSLNIFSEGNNLIIGIVSILLIFTLLVNIYKSYDVFLFIKKYGYVSYYKDYVGNKYMIILADSSYIFFYYYLALTSNKKVKLKRIILILFIIATFFVLIQGTRRFFVLNILLVLYYYLITSKKFSFRFILKLIIPVILLFVLFFMVSSVRMGRAQKNSLNLGDMLILFLEQQGVSIVVPSYGYSYQQEIPDKGLNYLIPDQINFLKNITRSKIDKSHREEQALEGNYLAQFISYKVMPSRFNKGEGMGGSFILEIYYYFGYIGLFIFSVLIGLFTVYASKTNMSGNSFLFVILLSILHYFFLMPRSYPSQSFFTITSLKFWFVFFSLFLLQTIVTYIKPKGELINGCH
ncbi:MAG TPA: O-antigen polysaccharide polymerase Wzy [Acholeplasmataceae bacterium]|nr:O-antigen polysaccharide polymerase Wzy [Acholeplasmataceae bacterium]